MRRKMFGFLKPKKFRSLDGCCICRAKSSSSRFVDSRRYETAFQSCFGLCETRSEDICNACVLSVKRWKKLPAGSKKNWSHRVDAKVGTNQKITVGLKKTTSLSRTVTLNHICRKPKELRIEDLDTDSITPSTSPAQSSSYSNQSDEGSDSEHTSGSSQLPVFSFLDLTYWKRQKVCCGIIYMGRFGEVLIDLHLFKPCSQKQQQQQQEEDEVETEEEEEEEGRESSRGLQSQGTQSPPHAKEDQKEEVEVEL
ncbi:hypothetical protein MATL_G00246190 [Megalops atlanticus]|uniref:SIN3-HDAC complex associated factor n=1 Tax=Megalops atlanticus TaxID=7932 RepID=A0A9D3SUZ2_MEGAT|nr:hypothetical protein MATL_G00246190 [Megalops atlanticus]